MSFRHNSKYFASKWERVSASKPCQVCGKHDFCVRTADFAIAGCMRIDAGEFSSKDTDIGTMHFHRLIEKDEGWRDRIEQAAPSPLPPDTPIADADTLHAVYSAMLKGLSLSQAHRSGLVVRGLTDAAIVANGYKTLGQMGRHKIALSLYRQFGRDALRVPGISVGMREHEGHSSEKLTISGPSGLLIPVRDAKQRIIAITVRRDDVSEGKYAKLSSAGDRNHNGPGPGSPAHVPIGVGVDWPENGIVRLTEGELKADIAFGLSGVPTIAFPGVGGWQRALTAAMDLLGVHTIRLAFDRDATTNTTVASNQRAAAETVLRLGLSLQIEDWSMVETGCKGIDDLLRSGRVPIVLHSRDAWHRVLADEQSAADFRLLANSNAVFATLVTTLLIAREKEMTSEEITTVCEVLAAGVAADAARAAELAVARAAELTAMGVTSLERRYHAVHLCPHCYRIKLGKWESEWKRILMYLQLACNRWACPVCSGVLRDKWMDNVRVRLRHASEDGKTLYAGTVPQTAWHATAAALDRRKARYFRVLDDEAQAYLVITDANPYSTRETFAPIDTAAAASAIDALLASSSGQGIATPAIAGKRIVAARTWIPPSPPKGEKTAGFETIGKVNGRLPPPERIREICDYHSVQYREGDIPESQRSRIARMPMFSCPRVWSISKEEDFWMDMDEGDLISPYAEAIFTGAGVDRSKKSGGVYVALEDCDPAFYRAFD